MLFSTRENNTLWLEGCKDFYGNLVLPWVMQPSQTLKKPSCLSALPCILFLEGHKYWLSYIYILANMYVLLYVCIIKFKCCVVFFFSNFYISRSTGTYFLVGVLDCLGSGVERKRKNQTGFKIELIWCHWSCLRE